MRTLSLRSWVLFLSLAPTLLIGLLFGGYFTLHRFAELEQSVIERGADIIEPLATSSEYGMVQNSREMLKRLVGVAHRKHSALVRTIAIFDHQHRLFVNSAFQRNFNQLRLPPGSAVPAFTEVETLPGGDLVLRTPIYQESNLVGLRADEQAPILGYVVVQLNTDHARIQQYQAAAFAMGIIIFGALLNLLFAFRLVHQVSEPVSEMVEAVDLIRKGRLDTRVGGPKMGELDALRLGINAMAKSLQESQQEMLNSVEQATADLRETMEQIEIQNIKLDMANKRATEAARTKSDFLANMSHELRTPLNAVIGFTRQLVKTEMSPLQRDYLATIERSANSLLNIINDVLDFSKLEAGKLKLEQMPFRLRDTLFEVATLLGPEAHHKRLELAVLIADDVPDHLIGDAFRIKQVLTNLMANAIKFTERGNVQVQVQRQGEVGDKVDLLVNIRDTGIGIAREQQSNLFSAFNQGDSTITRRYGGTGLGLVISQQIVRQMGGNVGFESELGRGSCFHFNLLCSRSPLVLGDDLPLMRVRDRRVLVYEPMPLSRRALVEPLSQWGAQVIACAEPFDWRVQIDSGESFDAAIISCAAAAGDVTIIERLISEARQRCARVSVVCSVDDPLLHQRVLASGADCCFVKPVSYPRLLQAIINEPLPASLLPPPLVLEQKVAARVLAVDDNPANLKLLEALLRDLVEQVDCRDAGHDAVLACERQHYDLILMDIQMPHLDGVSAAAQIRRSPLNRATPIVAVTAHALPGERDRLLAQGLDDYLTKPVDENALRALLRRWLKPVAGAPLDSNAAATADAPPLASDTLDWPLAIKRAAGKQEMAAELMAMLLASLPEAGAAIAQAQLQQDRPALLAQIHRLHGSCCYVGVPRLQKLAHTIETGIKQGLPLEDLEPELLELLDEIANVERAWRALAPSLVADDLIR